jgi:hypothetical protein
MKIDEMSMGLDLENRHASNQTSFWERQGAVWLEFGGRTSTLHPSLGKLLSDPASTGVIKNYSKSAGMQSASDY